MLGRPSLLERISSFAERQPSVVASCTSTTDWRYWQSAPARSTIPPRYPTPRRAVRNCWRRAGSKGERADKPCPAGFRKSTTKVRGPSAAGRTGITRKLAQRVRPVRVERHPPANRDRVAGLGLRDGRSKHFQPAAQAREQVRPRRLHIVPQVMPATALHAENPRRFVDQNAQRFVWSGHRNVAFLRSRKRQYGVDVDPRRTRRSELRLDRLELDQGPRDRAGVEGALSRIDNLEQVAVRARRLRRTQQQISAGAQARSTAIAGKSASAQPGRGKSASSGN